MRRIVILVALVAACGGNKATPDGGVMCESQADCAADPAHPICLGNQCVACDVNAACPAEAPVCDPTAHTCGGCSSATDCQRFSTTPECASSGQCVMCVSPTDCSAAAPVCSSAGDCSACQGESDCTSYATTPHCSTGGACVGCRGMADCNHPGESVCDPTTMQCRACMGDTECPSEICEPSGDCVDTSAVLYVSDSGTGSTCSQAQPCTLPSAWAKTSASVNYILVAPGTYDGGTFGNNASTVTIHAPGALFLPAASTSDVLTFGTGHVILEGARVRSGSGNGIVCQSAAGTLELNNVRVDSNGAYGVEGDCTTTITGSIVEGNGSHGVYFLSGKLTVSQSTIQNNVGMAVENLTGATTITQSKLQGNQAGGVVVEGSYTITNNFITGNGSATANEPGVLLGLNASPAVFDFNTVVGNNSTVAGTGVTCGSVTTAHAFHDNIIYGNTTGAGQSQTSGANCSYTYSEIGPGTAPSGTGNINTAPVFVNASGADYHVMATSPGVDKADPAATLDVDIDGDSRPQNGRDDIGADEYKP